LTEGSDAAGFRTYWGLPSTVKVYAYGSQDNLGNGEGFSLYNNSNAVVDSMPSYAGGTAGTSFNVPPAFLGSPQNAAHLVLSSVGDIYHTFQGGGGTGDLGNPGFYPVSVPEPASMALAVLGFVAAAVVRRSV